MYISYTKLQLTELSGRFLTSLSIPSAVHTNLKGPTFCSKEQHSVHKITQINQHIHSIYKHHSKATAVCLTSV